MLNPVKDIHVLPCNDNQSHTEGKDCPCNPEVENQFNGVSLIIHNYFMYPKINFLIGRTCTQVNVIGNNTNVATEPLRRGDEIDFNTISKWSEGTPEAYEQTLGTDRDEAVQVLYDLQVTQMIRSNHTDRLYNQIMRKIPSFLSLPELRFEKFMQLDDLGITPPLS